MKKCKKIQACQEIWDITDKIIADCGVKIHMTDIYLASPANFLEEEKDWEKIRKKWKLESYFDWQTKLALLALSIWEDRNCTCGDD